MHWAYCFSKSIYITIYSYCKVRETLLQLLVIAVTYNAMCDIKVSCTSLNRPVPRPYGHEHASTPSSHGEKDEITEALYGQVLPLLPKAFLLFRVQPQSFLSAPSKSNNRPTIPWERRWGRAQWERGIRHTAGTRGQPVGKRGKCAGRRQRDRKKEKKSEHLKGAFRF